MSITLRAKLFKASFDWNVNSNPTLCGFMKKYLTLKKTPHVNIFDHFIHLYLTKNIKKSKYIIGIFGDISGIISIKCRKLKKVSGKKYSKKKF